MFRPPQNFLLAGFLFVTVVASASPAAGAGAGRDIVLPDTVIPDPAHDVGWKNLFEQIGAPKTRISDFEERRFFPFRSAPILLQGEIRMVPDRGLSLSYFGAKPYIVIVDRAGVLMRDEHGRQRAAPADGRAQAATSALFHILQFDLPALLREFVIHGQRTAANWTLGFVPRDPTLAQAIGSVIVHGEQAHLDRIDMIKSDTQRIEILIRNTRDDVIFQPDVLERFFR